MWWGLRLQCKIAVFAVDVRPVVRMRCKLVFKAANESDALALFSGSLLTAHALVSDARALDFAEKSAKDRDTTTEVIHLPQVLSNS